MTRKAMIVSAIAALLAVSALLPTTAVDAAPVKTAKSACAAAKARVAAVRHFPISKIAFCDMIPAADSPRGFYVLALHSNRKCDGICSTNIGWFAIEKDTGQVFEWNVADMEVGPIFTGP